jgi:hypothetical protein
VIWSDAISVAPGDEFVERVSVCEPWEVVSVTARGGILARQSQTQELRRFGYRRLTLTKRLPPDHYKRSPLPHINAAPLWAHWRERPRSGKRVAEWRETWRNLLKPILGNQLTPALQQAADTAYQFAEWLHAAQFDIPYTDDPVMLYRGVRPEVGRLENGLFWSPQFRIAKGYLTRAAENNWYDPADDGCAYLITATVPRAKILWAMPAKAGWPKIYEVLVHLEPREWHRMSDAEMADAELADAAAEVY